MSTGDRARLRELEEVSFRSWPALSTERIGGWLLRFAEGYTKRANSVNVLEPDPHGLAGRVVEAEARYRAAGLAPVFRLTPLAEPDLDLLLAGRGYAVLDPSLVMTAPIGREPRRHDEVRVVEGDDPDWRCAQAEAAGLSVARADTQRRMLARVRGRAAFAMCHDTQGPAAFGIAVADGGRVGFFDILTRPAARRRGLGRRIMESLIAWARDEAGATEMWIQVVAANAPALALYDGLGFRTSYAYRYRVAPDATPRGPEPRR